MVEFSYGTNQNKGVPLTIIMQMHHFFTHSHIQARRLNQPLHPHPNLNALGFHAWELTVTNIYIDLNWGERDLERVGELKQPSILTFLVGICPLEALGYQFGGTWFSLGPPSEKKIPANNFCFKGFP